MKGPLTGLVAFEFDIYLRYASQVRKLFKDGKRQQLETMVSEIAVGLSALAAGKHEDGCGSDNKRASRQEAVGDVSAQSAQESPSEELDGLGSGPIDLIGVI